MYGRGNRGLRGMSGRRYIGSGKRLTLFQIIALFYLVITVCLVLAVIIVAILLHS
jgi:hypothetical protein